MVREVQKGLMNADKMDIVTLGPAGTFSELAAQDLIKVKGLASSISLEDDLLSVIEQVKPGRLGLVPIENLTEGFVSPVVDHLVRNPLQIIAETKLPVAFKILANSDAPEHLWAQFVAAGQCRRCIQSMALPVIHTNSNSDSMNKLLRCKSPAAAIVPAHIQCPSSLKVLHRTAADIEHNETRFVLLSAANAAATYDPATSWKSSVILVDDNDHPGLLVDSLSVFARRGINLTSIVSRPSGGKFGQYHFFIDFDGHSEQPHVKQALEQLAKLNQIRWLGSYKAA